MPYEFMQSTLQYHQCPHILAAALLVGYTVRRAAAKLQGRSMCVYSLKARRDQGEGSSTEYVHADGVWFKVFSQIQSLSLV